MKWLIRLLIKPLIKLIKEAIRLSNKLIETIEKLIVTVNGLPLEQAFKDEILKTLRISEEAILTVRAVLVKVLNYVGEDTAVPTVEETIEKTIESVKKSIK